MGSGCTYELAYLLPEAVGQFEVLVGSVPLDAAIEDGGLADWQVKKLNLIRDVRAYAAGTVKLNTEDSYTLFYDTGGEPLAFNVSACARAAFEPKTWSFPIVGQVPYLGFFDRERAMRTFEDLEQDNWDVFLYEVDAYSSLEFLPNPVFSPMLERSDLSIVETVFHELLHNTIWRAGDTTFNESLATFVGRAAALDFVAEHFPDQPGLLEEAVQYYEDNTRYNAFMADLFAELDAFYSSGLSEQERIEGRGAIFDAARERFMTEVRGLMHNPENYAWIEEMPSNNAWMLANRRYNFDLALFAQVHEAIGGDWESSLDVFRAAAVADDPWAFMRTWLVDGGNAEAESDALKSRPVTPRRGLCPRAARRTLVLETVSDH
jgi:predicted aminopeptidase